MNTSNTSKIKNSLVILLIIALYGCNPRSNQVWFTELQAAHEVQQQSVERLYLDKNGHLYPSKEIDILYKEFYDPFEKGKTHQNKLISGSLEHYFTGLFSNYGKIETLKSDYDYEKRSKQLKNRYGLAEELGMQQTFDSAQLSILKESSQYLNSELNKSSSKTLVVLIHGFNDPNPSADYNRLRNRIGTIVEDNDFVYLEMYWNGLTANQGHPGKSKIWGAAQYNSCESAVTLRLLLNQITKGTNVRIIAHSTGASLATSALFNTTSKWNDVNKFPRYSKLLEGIPAPNHLKIHLGVLAPAIPGVSTFLDFNKRGDSNFSVAKNNIEKVIVGYNCNDYAVTKRLFGKDYLSNKFGSTSLGANHKNEIENTRKALVDSGYSPSILIDIPFNQFECKTEEEEHGVYYFMIISEVFNSYLKEIFISK